MHECSRECPWKDHERRLEAIELRLDRGAERFDMLHEAVAENTDITREVRELMELGRAGFRLLGYVQVAAVWVTKLSAAVATLGAIWYAVRHGRPPTE